jgi:MoaA/NifB/PqqE/SkfB family radical SAM enzyme
MIETAFEEAIPLTAQFEITYRCNHLCTFCYNSPTGQRELTTPQIFEALRKISEFGVLYLTLTGGEALCHKDFFKIAREAKRLGMALRIYSNGYLMADPKMVRRIVELNPMEVEISIHGARPESHDALTKIKGSYEKTVRAIENLVEAGVKVVLKCPITSLNQDELFEIKAFGDRFGLQVQFDAVITPKDDGDTSHFDLRPTDAFYARYWAEDYLKLHGGRMPPKKNHCASEGSEANCGTGRSGFTLDPYGNVLPCVALRRPVANILEVDSLEQVWNTSPVLIEVRDLAVKARDAMNRHELGDYVQFCPGVAETQTGDPLELYEQAAVNARSVKRAYELLQIEDTAGQKSA